MISSVPPLAVTVFVVPVPPLATLPVTLPNPISVPALVPLPRVIPEASVSVPPDIWILPSETVSAALIVRLPVEPTCSVWLALLIVIAPEVTVPVMVRFAAAEESIANVLLPPSDPAKVSVPPLAVITALVIVPFTAPLPVMLVSVSVPPDWVTVPLESVSAPAVPLPVSVAPLPIVTPDESVSVPPDSMMVPLVMLSAVLIVRLPPVPTCKVWLALLIVTAPIVAVPLNSRTEGAAVAIA